MTDRPTLPPEDDRDFHQLTGAFDRLVAPSPAFAERLKQRVVDAQHEHRATDMHAHTAMEPRVSRMTDSRVIPMPPQRSGGSIMEMIAAAVLIFALVSSGFYLYRIQNGTTPTDPDGQRLAATTPLASPTPVSEESAATWTDPGHTNAYPAGFDPASAHSAEPVVDLPFKSVYGRIVKDSLIVYGLPNNEMSLETWLSVIDLRTGQERWTASMTLTGPYAADDNAIYAQEIDESPNSITIHLVAISIETGERLWTHEVQRFDDLDNSGINIVSPLRPVSFVTPITIDGNLYVARTTGDVFALDGATGEVLWETESDTDMAIEDALGGSLVGDDRHLYVVEGENAVVKLDRETGAQVDKFAVNLRPPPTFVIDLYLQGDRLVMVSQDAWPEQHSRVVIDVLDTDDGGTRWNTNIGPLAGSLIITDTILGLPVSYPPGVVGGPGTESSPESTLEPNVVQFFNLETGEHLTNLGSSHWGGASASASGAVICLHGTTSEITCFDTDDQESGPYLIDTGAAYVAEGPPPQVLFWKDSAIVLGHEGGPHIIRSDSGTNEATSVATPQVSPDATEGENTIIPGPGNTGRVGDVTPVIDSSILMTVSEDDADISPPVDAVVSGNFLITRDFANDTPLQVRDLTSGEVLWASDIRPLGRLVADSGRMYLVVPSDRPGGASNLLVLDIATGEIAWSRPAVTGFDMSGLGISGPVVTANHVLLVDAFGNTLAVDRESGESAWQYPETQIFTMPNTEREYSHTSIVATDDAAFVTTPTNDLLKLDLETGEPIDSVSLGTLVGNEPIITTLHVSGDRLAMMVYWQSRDRAGDISLVLFDAGDLAEVAQQVIRRQSAIPVSPVLTDDAIYIPAEDGSAFEMSIQVFGLATGEEQEPIYTREGLGIIHLSLAGNALLVTETYTNNEISRIDLDSGETETWVIEPDLRPYQRGQELGAVLLWEGEPLIVRGSGQLVDAPLHPAGEYADTATPEAPAEPVTSSVDPNRTGVWPAGFQLSGPLVAQPIDGYQGHAASGVVVGDVLIAENKALSMVDPPTFSGTGIYAQDLRTGEILWRNTDHINDRYTADESGVYVLPQPTTNRQHLIALDPETGEERWRSEPMSDYSSYPEDAPFLHALNPVAIDGFVHVPFVDGTVLAFDGASGKIAWQYTPDDIADVNDVHGHASVAGTSDRIYAANGANVISVLHRESGELVREIRVKGVAVDDYRIDVIAGENHLLIQASSLGSSDPDGMLIAIDADSGEEMWRQDTDVMVSNVLVSPTTVGVMHTDYDPANLVEQVILDEELEGTTELSLFDIATGKPIGVPDGVFTPIEGVWSGALAASGETICVAYTTVTCFDGDGNVATVEGFEAEDVTSPQGLVFWGDRLVILDARESIHIVPER